MSDLVHATCVAVDSKGVLLRGPSGAGKSDLALRLIDGGGVLVADDYVKVMLEDGQVMAHAPETISGLIEARGVGLLHVPHQTSAPVHLVVDLVDASVIERLPETETLYLDPVPDVPIRRIQIAPFEVSAVAKICLLLKEAAC